MNVILYSDKKWPDPQTQLSPSKVQVLAKRSRSHLVTSTGPVVVAEEARCPGSNWPWAPQATQVAGTRSCRLWPRERGRCPYRQGWGRGSPSPQSLGRASRWSWWGLWSPTGHSPPPLSPSRSLVSWRAPGRRLESVSYLTLCLPGDHHSIDCWLTAEPLTVTHWQLVAWGRGPLQQQPMAEQDH